MNVEKLIKSLNDHKVKYGVGGGIANFASLDDLIRMKKAAGRPKDKEDLRYLEEIRKQKNKNN